MALYSDTPIQYLKGVGPRLGQVLGRKGVRQILDLVEFYPRAYEDRRAARSISSLNSGDIVSLAAEVINVSRFNLGRSKRKIYDVFVKDETGRIHCKYFRVPYKGYFDRFQPGDPVRIIGKVTEYRGKIEFHHPDIQDVREGDAVDDQLVPIYPETEGLSSTKLRKLIQNVFKHIDSGEIDQSQFLDPLPKSVRDKLQLPSRIDALRAIHMPPEQAGREFFESNSSFHRRIIFEEFFWLELFLAAKRMGLQREKAAPMEQKLEWAKKLREALPFELTGDQVNCFKEIVQDMTQPHPMHRMVQGDVGSGKTLVAMLSCVFAAENGYQSALMVPTEILAEQHFKNATELFKSIGLRVELLTGSMKASEKGRIYRELVRGDIDLIVGTHALIQDQVEFKNLGLVVIDEQHRFGVEQRHKLKQKGLSPHFLLMTATPIPRTLAMTVYGDLDVSLIKERPKGRKPIVTRVTYESKWDQVMNFLEEQLKKGRQAYVVYPLVEESEKIELKNAMDQFKKIGERLGDFNVGLIHGKMKSDEKDSVMNEFRQNKLQVLVSTTVIEVGVDVPNANIMVIEHAERFGLSQLHQLRGRVGRGEHKSYCVLVLGKAVSAESRDRCQILEKSDDGFKISEADLEIRGPGEFMGARQSGLPGFKMANLVRDFDILKEARNAAFEILNKDPKLQHPDHAHLREELLKTHGSKALAFIG